MRRNKRRLFIVCMITICSLVLTSCNNKKTVHVIEYTDMKSINNINFTDSQDLSDKLDMIYYSFGVPDNSYVQNFCIYDSIVYYVITCYDFKNLNGDYEENDPAKMTPSYTTQIRYYDAVKQENDIVYEFDGDLEHTISDIQCNGNYLVLMESDYTVNSFKLNIINLTDKTVDTVDMNNSVIMDFYARYSLTMMDKSIYWFSMKQVGQKATLSKYDFETKEIDRDIVVTKDDCQCYAYCIYKNEYIMSELDDDNDKQMYMGDINSKYTNYLKIDTLMTDPLCNNKMCVWTGTSNSGNDMMLYIYDYINKDISKLEQLSYMQYGIIDRFLFINDEQGLTCYDINSKKKLLIPATDNNSVYMIQQGMQNDLVAQCSTDIDLSDKQVYGSNTSQTYAPSSKYIVMQIRLK